MADLRLKQRIKVQNTGYFLDDFQYNCQCDVVTPNGLHFGVAWAHRGKQEIT